MDRRLCGLLRFLVYSFILFAATTGHAQSVSITTIDPGPYTPGSSLAVRIDLTNAACLNANNVLNLYLSDANGSFANETLIGKYDGFGTNGAYASFVNGTIPTTTTNGTGYKVRVKTTSPASVSAESPSFYIIPGTSSGGTLAGAKSAVIDPANPEVYGTCTSQNNNSFNFQNTSTTGSVVTATFYNELSGATEGSFIFPASNLLTFNANQANYTVFIRALNGNGGVGTKAYLLMNNVANTNFGTTSSSPVVCLTPTGASVAYSVNLSDPINGIQNNYPGTIYNINWGDGTSNDLTFCQIKATNGLFAHNYIATSCGKRVNNVVTNAYQISFTAKNPFCSSSNVPITVSQAVLNPPKNIFTGPTSVCTGTAATFTNTSYPGQAVGTRTSTCTDPNATYSWYIDGDLKASGLKLTDSFSWNFTTRGSHTVLLKLENSASCTPTDYSINVCVQDPPQPKFTLSDHTVCTPGTVNTTDISVLDNTCNSAYTYLWTVTPATGFSYASGNKNSKTPSFKFSTPGKYAVQLQITAPGNGCAAQSAVDTVYANTIPQITLSSNFSTCGKNQTFRFGAEPGSTHVTYSGTYQLQPDTYTWTITPPTGGAAATFASNTTANSQSPSITFPDFGTYTITVVQKNSCGATATSSQNITFQDAPTVNAGTDQTICAGQPATLNAVVANGASVNGAPTWSGGTASGFSDPHNLNTTYTPTAAEVNAGSVTLTVTVPTSLQGACNTVSDQVVINFYPYNTITSAATLGICSGKPLHYAITSSVAGSTYTWTATGSANAGGYTASGSGDINEASLTNSSATTDATVTYTITPHSNGCDGTPFNFTVSIVPQPQITATGPGTICSGQPVNITLGSNVTNTSYTWAVTTSDPANVSGFASISTLTATSQIQEIIVNKGTSPATVTYTISSANSGSADNCAGNTETVTVTIQPAPVVANAGADAKVCNVTSYQLKGNDLGANGHGMWTLQSGQSGISFDDPTKRDATVTGLQPGQAYKFRWTSSGVLPCNDSYAEVVIDNQLGALTADFTVDKQTGCDPLTVTFTNKTAASNGITYAWDFGNGIKSTLVSPPPVTYAAQTNGKDSVYTVTLTIANSCTIDTKTITITAKPKVVIAQMAPDRTTGCVPFMVNLENLSPGTNDNYTYFLLDASNNIVSQSTRTDKDDQPFSINTPGTYKVYMVAKSRCGIGKSQQYTIVVTKGNATPRLTVNGDESTGCGPLTVTFHNNTTGATSYRYDWGDGTTPLVTNSIGDVNHTFLKGGVYNVVLHASNGCTVDIASAPVTINVLYQPELSFKADITTGCKKLTVQFTNTSTDNSTSEATDLKYDWDFGDGSAHSRQVNPIHKYDFKKSPYTVTLTATNGTGCTNTYAIKDMIVVNTSSITEFAAKPDSVINIPNYRFSFVDLSTNGPLTWKWNFGDGGTSTSKNPDHTYADTGLYKVTLTTSNAYCDSTKSHYVRITGIPGQVYMPNAFMPGSVTPSLRTFSMKGSGLQDFHLQIFNNYGQMVWETSKLSAKGEPVEEWDGTFKGSPLPQGVYVWQASGKFLNGNEWKGMSYNNSPPKRTGVIHLIR